MSNSITKHAVMNAVLTAIYVAVVASFLSHAQEIFGADEPKVFLVPMAMLLLLVLSAAVTGFLVFGRPVMWYIEGKKKEAVSLLAQTLASLFVIVVILFAALYFVSPQ